NGLADMSILHAMRRGLRLSGVKSRSTCIRRVPPPSRFQCNEIHFQYDVETHSEGAVFFCCWVRFTLRDFFSLAERLAGGFCSPAVAMSCERGDSRASVATAGVAVGPINAAAFGISRTLALSSASRIRNSCA